jgi:hypothetical protein
MISHEWGKDRKVFTTSGIYPWSFVTKMFRNSFLQWMNPNTEYIFFMNTGKWNFPCIFWTQIDVLKYGEAICFFVFFSCNNQILPQFDFLFQNNKVFKNILDDVFTGLPDTPSLKNTNCSARSRGIDIELSLKHKAVDKGLSAHDPWIGRCKQLYEISQVYHG